MTTNAHHNNDKLYYDTRLGVVYTRDRDTQVWTKWKRAPTGSYTGDGTRQDSVLWYCTSYGDFSVFGGAKTPGGFYSYQRYEPDVVLGRNTSLDDGSNYVDCNKFDFKKVTIDDRPVTLDRNGTPLLFEGQKVRVKKDTGLNTVYDGNLVKTHEGTWKFYRGSPVPISNFEGAYYFTYYEGKTYTVEHAKDGVYTFESSAKKKQDQLAKQVVQEKNKSHEPVKAVETVKEKNMPVQQTPLKNEMTDIMSGIAMTVATDSSIAFITRKLAAIAISNERHDLAELLIDRSTREIVKFVMPASLLGIAYAFSDAEDESTRLFCQKVIPSLKMAVVAGGSGMMSIVLESVIGSEEDDMRAIRDAISDKKAAMARSSNRQEAKTT